MKQLELMREQRRRAPGFFLRILIARALYHTVFVPLSYALAPLLRRARVRVLQIGLPQHIGHLSLEPDCYV